VTAAHDGGKAADQGEALSGVHCDDEVTPRDLAVRVARAKISASPSQSQPPRPSVLLVRVAIPILLRRVSIKTLAPKPGSSSRNTDSPSECVSNTDTNTDEA
jgi:hypothetical protein